MKLHLPKSSLLNSNGFTLIELLVVISIATVIGSISLAAYNTFSRKQDVDQSALRLQSIFDEARFSALSIVRPADKCPETATLPSPSYKSTRQYIVELKNNVSPTIPDEYFIKAICIKSGGGETTVEVEKGKLPSSVSFNPFDGCGGVYYYESITNKFYCGATSPGVELTSPSSVTVGNGSDIKTLIISQNGKVTVQ